MVQNEKIKKIKIEISNKENCSFQPKIIFK